jgi:dipeptidyl aminopeptidase/acylaminoacyl peptidase
VERRQPARPVELVTTPTLLVYGAQSGLVAQGEPWYEALRRAGVPAELVVEPGQGHTFDGDETANVFHRRVAAWFSKHK